MHNIFPKNYTVIQHRVFTFKPALFL